MFLCLLTMAAIVPAAPSLARPGGGVRPAVSSAPRMVAPPALPRSFNPEMSAFSRQARLERLTNASTKLFGIVPPNPPDLAANSPLPGYRIIRLGRKYNNRLCFAGTINGTKGLIMLDTGAANTALNETTYRALRLRGAANLPSGVPHALRVNGQETPVAQAPDFRVGPSNLGTVPVTLIPQSYLVDSAGNGGGQVYDGLLGQNILRHYGAMIDCAKMMLYLDLDPSKKLDLSASFAQHGWTRVPLIDTGSHYLVSCVLDGHRYRLVVDTGAPFTTLDLDLLRSAQIATHATPWRQSLLGRDAEQVSFVDLDQLQIGSYLARDVHMIASAQSVEAFAGHDRSSEEPVVGLLGGDLLARHGAFIDIGNKALYLKAVTADAPATRNRTAVR